MRCTRWCCLAAVGFLLPACGSGGTEPVAPSPPIVTTVSVVAPSGTLFVDDTIQVVLTVHDQHGAVLSGRSVTWSSSHPSVATVDNGRVIGLDVGATEISAVVEGKTGNLQLSVTGPLPTGGVPGSALLGAPGGTVAATLPGGGSLSLMVPAGALSDTVRVTLEPLVPVPPSQAAFHITPAGLELRHPATLVIQASHGAKITASSALVFDQDGNRFPLPSVPNPATRSLSVSLPVLGLPATADTAASTALRMPEGSRAHANGPGTGNVVSQTLNEAFNDATAALRQLQQLGSIPAERIMLLSMQALLFPDPDPARADARFPPLVDGWRNTACGLGSSAITALRGFVFTSDFGLLENRVSDAFKWGLATDALDAELSDLHLTGCPGGSLGADTVITDRVIALVPAISAELNGYTIVPSPRDSFFIQFRLKPLLQLIANLQIAVLDTAAGRLLDLIPPQVDRLRVAGYVECRFKLPQAVQSRLIRLAAQSLATVARFPVSKLDTDVEVCGMDIAWRVTDSAGTAVADGSLGGGNALGEITATGDATLDGPGVLEIGGNLNALRCPSPASANNEQLEFLAGSSLGSLNQVGLLTPANDNTYLSVSQLRLADSTLRRVAGRAATASGDVFVVIQRRGETCSGMFPNLSHNPLGTLTLHLQGQCTPNVRASLRTGPTVARAADCGRVIPGDVTVSSAAALAALSDVEKIQGNLTIQSIPATDLHDLAKLRVVTGKLSLLSLFNLTSLAGIEGMTTLGGLQVISVPNLHRPELPSGLTDLPLGIYLSGTGITDLGGFVGLGHAGSMVLQNTGVTSLIPLQHTSIASVTINGSVLTSLAGLRVTPVMNSLSLADSPVLTDISTLAPLTDLTGSLELIRPAFTSLAPLAHLRTIGGGLSIWPSSALSGYSFPALTQVGNFQLVTGTGCPVSGTISMQFPALTTIGTNGFAALEGSLTPCAIDVDMSSATDRGPFIVRAGVRTIKLKSVVNSPTPNVNMKIDIANSTLASLTLSEAVNVEGLRIEDNSSLSVVSGLQGTLRGDMVVKNNPALSTKDILAWLLSVGGQKTISGNGMP